MFKRINIIWGIKTEMLCGATPEDSALQYNFKRPSQNFQFKSGRKFHSYILLRVQDLEKYLTSFKNVKGGLWNYWGRGALSESFPSRLQVPAAAPSTIKSYQDQNSVCPKKTTSPFANLFCFESLYIFLALLIIKIIKWSDSDALMGLSSGFRVKGLGCVKCYF